MDPQRRIVTKIPLTELWGPRHPVEAERIRELDRSDLVLLLRNGPVQFVVADVGHALEWKDMGERYNWWKAEVQDRVLDPEGRWFIGELRDGYGYRASEWLASELPPIVLLERYH